MSSVFSVVCNAALVWRRVLYAVDDQHLHRAFRGFELETQLLLDRGEQVRRIGIERESSEPDPAGSHLDSADDRRRPTGGWSGPPALAANAAGEQSPDAGLSAGPGFPPCFAMVRA